MGFANENPFSYTTAEGELAGVDVDILRHILADMGVKKIEGGLTTFGDLIPGLQDEQFDLIASAIYIKPERCALWRSASRFTSRAMASSWPQAIPRASRVTPTWPPTRRSSSAIPPGARAGDNAKAMGVSEGQLIDFPDTAAGFAAVKEGRIDGYATVGMNIEMALREMKDPGLERADPFEQPVVGGKVRYGITSFAVRLEDQDLLDALNQRLLAFRGTPSTWRSWRSTASPRPSCRPRTCPPPRSAPAEAAAAHGSVSAQGRRTGPRPAGRTISPASPPSARSASTPPPSAATPACSAWTRLTAARRRMSPGPRAAEPQLPRLLDREVSRRGNGTGRPGRRPGARPRARRTPAPRTRSSPPPARDGRAPRRRTAPG